MRNFPRSTIMSLASLFLFSVPVPTNADPISLATNQPPQIFFDKARIGIGFAGEYLNAEAKLNLQPSSALINGTHEAFDFTSQQLQTGKRFPITPCIEVGNTFNKNFYLGLLASWRYSNLKIKSRSDIAPQHYFWHEYSLKHSTDIFIKAGYRFPKTMIYGLIGSSLARWTHKSAQITPNGRTANIFSINKLSWGVGIGAGIEYIFHKNYAFSVDYTHHFYWPTSKSQPMAYTGNFLQPLPLRVLPDPHSGDLTRKINLSYATIAFRFTAFFQL